ncbi:MAG: right-handed parallel beta-helix repeat-containing protein [Fimbriimonadaceae bacterium]|nr:right-handed parallel beta-helix repeat-containing protein [Fimbriimonadaceae bacterium]
MMLGCWVALMTGMSAGVIDQKIITKSGRVDLKEIVMPGGDSPDQAAVVVRGDGLTIDFTGTTLRGTPATVEPDQRKGFGLVVQGKNITIKGLNVHGYKVGIYADDADGLKLLNCDASYNWKQKLKSGRLREDTSDWMSFHDNEQDQWLRFGAAVYLKNLEGFEVRGVEAIGGQCGLMMTRCSGGTVWNNNFSYLSAIGVGMYRSSHNRVMHNSIDYCVRGYSHRFYNRGQDSAGILMYEQSSNNVVAYNSVTHGGDGLFLWAGQSTMDTGQGGCNDNVFYGNDFSHAPTNGIETTFSRNVFANNLVLENWHGVWGGYSYETVYAGNAFGMNGEAFAIEHGQNNKIIGNTFRLDTVALNLFERGADPDWAYAKARDTKSRDFVIAHNWFEKIPGVVFEISKTKGVSLTGNFANDVKSMFGKFEGVESVSTQGENYFVSPDDAKNQMNWPMDITQPGRVTIDPLSAPPTIYMETRGLVRRAGDELARFQAEISEIDFKPWQLVSVNDKKVEDHTPRERRDAAAKPYYVSPLEEGIMPFLGAKVSRGRSTILVDQWGPVDYKSPVLWLEDWYDSPSGGKYYVFKVVGPKSGGWRITELEGGKITKMLPEWRMKIPTTPPFVPDAVSKLRGNMGDHILVRSNGQFRVSLEYVGEETTDYRGIKTPAGKPVEFGYTHDEVGLNWNVSWWNYDFARIDPREKPEEFRKMFDTEPVVNQRMNALEGAWGGSPAPGVNTNHFATLAETRFTVEPGDYTLSLTSDDGVRVLLDGKVIFEDWTWHAPKSDVIKLKLGGRHNLRIEHFELDGYSALQARLTKD